MSNNDQYIKYYLLIIPTQGTGMDMTAITGTLRQILDAARATDNEIDSGRNTIASINAELKRRGLIMTDGSMIKLLNKYIISPNVIVSNDLKHEEITIKVTETVINMFTAYYTQVFDVMTKIDGVEHNIALNLLSTDTSFSGESRENDWLMDCNVLDVSNEILSDADYIKDRARKDEEEEDRYRLGQRRKIEEETLAELKQQPIDAAATATKRENEETTYRGGTSRILESKDTSSIINKRIELEILLTAPSGDRYTVVIPVLVKANILYAENASILNLLAKNTHNTSSTSRLDEYRSGGISLANLWFGNDIVKKYKSQQLKNSDELSKLIDGQTINAAKKLLLHKSKGFEKHYNMYLISNELKRALEREVGGKISKTKYADKFFDSANGLLISVVDQDSERVVIYTKDISGRTDISFKSLSKNGGGTDMTEMLKALTGGRPPVL